MLFQPYIVIYQNVQGHSAVAWPPLCTTSKCFISSQNFFTLWPGKLHMISDRDICGYESKNKSNFNKHTTAIHKEERFVCKLPQNRLNKY